MKKCILILGSEKDAPHAEKIESFLTEYSIAFERHVASAHKMPLKVLEVLQKNEEETVVYITIAGRSNALSGFCAGNTKKPVLACPPFSDKIDMMVNIHSTIQMPSSVPVLTVLEPQNAALAVRNIFLLF